MNDGEFTSYPSPWVEHWHSWEVLLLLVPELVPELAQHYGARNVRMMEHEEMI
jgi:hypothetical protein